MTSGQTGRSGLLDGSRVAVIGGGPSGSFFSYFLLDMCQRIDLDLQLDIFEPRDFTVTGPAGCNMCGGIISESLVQMLAVEGINLPASVVQRGIDSYMLHADIGSVRIETPLREKRIASVHRGSGPRDVNQARWSSFDGYLLSLAEAKGARVIHSRVVDLARIDGFPAIKTRSDAEFQVYDFVAVAVGVNTNTLSLMRKLQPDYNAPESTKTYICEYYLGEQVIEQHLGNSMQVFLLNIPRLEFAAIIPKGDYATVCLLGEDIDKHLLQAFFTSPAVIKCMPVDWSVEKRSCFCSPRLNTRGTGQAYGDRVVFIGDCGVTRLYKDGIGAAYRTAKAAASAAVFADISKHSFHQHYQPACKEIERDNFLGKLVFLVTRQIQGLRFARHALLQVVNSEQQKEGRRRYMSLVLWDMFTGSAAYREILLRTLQPGFVFQFLRQLLISGWMQVVKQPLDNPSSDSYHQEA